MAERVDVRILKTKERLKIALLETLESKSLDQITISEICKKASVNRNTFYSHYQSVKDLLYEVEANFLEEIISKIHMDSNSSETVAELLTKILDCVKDNKEMCTLLFTENGDKNLIKTILMFVLPSAVKNWSEEFRISTEKATRLYYFVIGGAVNVIELWIKEGFIVDTVSLANDLTLLITKGQGAFYNEG